MKKEQKPLRCVLCEKRFSEQDAANFSFFVQTSTCFYCYNDLSKNPFQGPKGTCFGKSNKTNEVGTIVGFGYDPMASSDCAFHCPHREICPLFAKKKIFKIRSYLITPYMGESAKALQTVLKGCTRIHAVKTILNRSRVAKDVLRGNYAGKTWVLNKTKRIVKAYFVKKVRIGEK